MGKKNKKNRQESRRRYSEKKRRYSRLFDLTTGGVALLILISVLVSASGSDLLSESSGAGFARWFLVVLGYLPIMLFGAIRFCFGMGSPEAVLESARIMGVVDFVFLLVVWGAVRLIGRRHSPDFTRRAWHLMLIIFYWGIFQLFCFGTALFFPDPGSAPLPDFETEEQVVVGSITE